MLTHLLDTPHVAPFELAAAVRGDVSQPRLRLYLFPLPTIPRYWRRGEVCILLPFDQSSQELLSRAPATMSNAELATSYAALILADDGVDITVRAQSYTTSVTKMLI